jgi:ribonuclease P protein component
MAFILRKRSDFLAIAKYGFFVRGHSVLMQICRVRFNGLLTKSSESEPRNKMPALCSLENATTIAPNGQHASQPQIFYGITASKKVGNAVCRNRAKRRLRALVRSELASILQKELAGILQKESGGLRAGCWQATTQQNPRLERGTGNYAFLSTKTANNTLPAGVELGEKNAERCIGTGFAFVFIASKNTPVAKWQDLKSEFCREIRDGISKVDERRVPWKKPSGPVGRRTGSAPARAH